MTKIAVILVLLGLTVMASAYSLSGPRFNGGLQTGQQNEQAYLQDQAYLQGEDADIMWMTSWVCTEILMRDSPSSRATVIEHFIQIALYCYRHNDLHCSLNVTFALSSSIIRGLRKTWEEVDKKFHEKFKKLRELADHQGRCKKLREKLEKTTWAHVHKTGEIPAALPYIGAYLDQIYSLEMCTKTYNKDNLVNFTKMTKLAHVVARMLMYQKTRFKFEPKLDVIAYMTSAKRLSENDLYELSCQIEPTSKS